MADKVVRIQDWDNNYLVPLVKAKSVSLGGVIGVCNFSSATTTSASALASYTILGESSSGWIHAGEQNASPVDYALAITAPSNKNWTVCVELGVGRISTWYFPTGCRIAFQAYYRDYPSGSDTTLGEGTASAPPGTGGNNPLGSIRQTIIDTVPAGTTRLYFLKARVLGFSSSTDTTEISLGFENYKATLIGEA